MPDFLDPVEVKESSERVILAAGGRICEGLPYLNHTQTRKLEDIVDRALILNAMFQIHFGAPPQAIADWIERNSISHALSPKESDILRRDASMITDQEKIDLYWYIEALWAFLWATQLIDEMPFDRGIEDYMASLCPNLQKNEDGSKFRDKMNLRPHGELFKMLDLYYRLHWWTRDAGLRKENTGKVNWEIIVERRKALEWVMDDQLEWDDVPLDT